MLQSIKQLYGEKLGALDGEIGRVRDFYFDDQKWAVRYVVADTGAWLTSRQVLLSPRALGGLYQDGKVMLANLTRKQIEDSPPIEWHKPVSRQFEEEYHRYYGWPDYWQGDGLWGVNEFPILTVPPKSLPGAPAVASQRQHEPAEDHLRSTQAVTGYHLQASDGITGHVCDFMMDDQNWAIGQLVVRIGHRFTGQEVLIPTNKVSRISYEDSTVFVSLTKEAVGQGSARNPSPFVAAK
jgi:hypothetical protein